MLNDFYHLEYLDYCFHLHCYTLSVLANVSFGLHQVFYVELRSLYRTLNWTLYLIQRVDCSHSIKHDWVQVLSYCRYPLLFTVVETEPAISRWFHLEALFNQMPITIILSVLLDNSLWILENYKPNVFINQWDSTHNDNV